MTTRVEINYPVPNHQRVLVTIYMKDARGTWIEQEKRRVTLGPGENELKTLLEYVHDGQRLVIEEIP